MADTAYHSPPPPTISPPPPVYSQRSPPTLPNDVKGGPSHNSLARKPLPPPKDDSETSLQNTPSAVVHISPHPSLSNIQPSSAQIEHHGFTPSPSQSRSTSGNFEDAPEVPPHQHQASPTRQVSLPFRHKQSNSLSDLFKKRRSGHSSPHDTPGLSLSPEQNNPQNVSRHASTGSTDSEPQPVDLQPQLQYHHAPFHEPEDASRAANRASKATMRSSLSDTSSGENNGNPSHHHLAPDQNRLSRNSFTGRPNSAFSSLSDVGARGRTRSPQLSPNLYGRAPSAHSRGSPDTRGSPSLVDLLNVPYGEQKKQSASLNHAHLQSVVGNHASLLSTKKTLEMYRANVKKTNEPNIQYEFAVFMIATAREAGATSIDENDNPVSEKASENSQVDLLREAKSILQRLSDRSYPFAQYYLADGYASGLFSKGKEDYDKAFPLFVSASKHGHAEASYRAALCYEFGWGCRVDAAKAVLFYRHSASKNHPGACLRLGRACLYNDMGLTGRYREGVKWMRWAVDAADVQYNAAPYEMGVLYENGFGDDIFQDETYTAQLFTKAADLGHAEANYRLGDAYEHGRLGCPRDPALSVHFYTGAAQAGHPVGMMALCAWYMVGAEPVLEKDENEAYEWARRSAECGYAKAEYAVGYFTEMGIGCRRDPLEANVWYVRAADQGDERAKVRIAAIREAASGGPTGTEFGGKKGHKKGENASATGPGSDSDKGKGKKFGIF